MPLLCSSPDASGRLPTVIFRRVGGHLKTIFVDDVRKLPTFHHLHEIAVIAERLRQFPHPLYTLVGAGLEPENRAAGDHPARRGQVLIEPDEGLSKLVTLVEGNSPESIRSCAATKSPCGLCETSSIWVMTKRRNIAAIEAWGKEKEHNARHQRARAPFAGR
jgi:hypothetical protein